MGTRNRFTALALLSAICCLATAATAQDLNRAVKGDVAAPPPPVNPCSVLGNPPTVGSCWDCFLHLLADCDGANNNADRRRACYEGANNFFTWCLGKAQPPAPVVPANPRRGQGNMNLREGFAYELVFSSVIDPANIEVYVRDVQNGQPRMQQVKAFAFANEGRSVSIFFDNNNIGIEDDSTVGIVTIVRNPATHAVELAYADAFDVFEPLDLNGDGTIDAFDYTEAWNQYANGELSYDGFVSYLDKFMGR